jgi:PPOX class probable F420-dependent enzyme
MSEPRADAPAMKDYGVGGPAWEPLPWSWAAERLDANRNFWVVTASAGGRPHALPVWGVWHDGDQRFVFSCSPNARKARNIAANPQVAFMVDDTVECVSVEGVARVVEAGDPSRETWIERYVTKYRPMSAELSDAFVRSHQIIEVTPRRAFAIIERDDEFVDRATRWTFDT